MATRKIVGLFLSGIGIILFLVFLVFGDLGAALVLSNPFILCALICFLVSRYPALWCGWVLYILISLYLRFDTGIRVWWIFSKWIYREGLEIHAIIAWALFITFCILVAVTIRLIIKMNRRK